MKLIRAVIFNLLASLGLVVVFVLILITLKESYGVLLIDVPYIGYILGAVSMGFVIWLGDVYCYDIKGG